MKMNDAYAEREFVEAVAFVLNRIKRALLFNTENNQAIEYMVDLNIKQRNGPGLMEEQAILQKLRTDGIISDVSEADTVEFGIKGTPKYGVYSLFHFMVSEKFNDYYDRYQKIQNVTQNYCWFDNNTFTLILRDSSSFKSITFDTQRGNRQSWALFQTIIEHWKVNGNKPITGDVIVKSMAKFGSKVDTAQLKNIISNVRNKKIKPAGLENKIHIEYDKKASGWKVDVKR